MSKLRSFFTVLALVVGLSVAAFAQAPPKNVLINTANFYDEKAGITKLIAAEKQINAEFAKELKDFQDGSAKLAIIAAELEKPITAANQAAMIAKKEEGDTLQRKLTYDKSNLEAKVNKRREEVLAPITFDIGKAISEFGKKNNYGAIFDASKLVETGALIYIGENTDVTKDFIAFYNARAAAVPIK